jgi:hypothetical protein
MLKGKSLAFSFDRDFTDGHRKAHMGSINPVKIGIDGYCLSAFGGDRSQENGFPFS